MNRVQTLSERLCRIADTHPDRHCVSDRPYGRFTYGQIAEQIERVAFGLTQRGIGKGDMVIAQLPNWVPFLVFHLALTRIGAITALIPITFREHEVRNAVMLTCAKAIIVPATFAGHDYKAMASSVGNSLNVPLEIILVYGGEGQSSHSELSYENLLASRPGAIAGIPVGLNDLTAICFTSGTTGALKAAMFDTQILHATNQGLQSRYGLNADDRILGCSPVGHAVGFTHTLRMTITIGGSIALLDRWDAEDALRTAQAEGSTFMAGATPFLMDIVYHPALKQHNRLRSVRLFLCGGATIPRQLMKDARKALPGTFTSPLWGMTECGGVTTCPFDAPSEKLFTTDGVPCDGMEARVVDAAGRPLASGQEGELQVRGKMITHGYFGEPELTKEVYLPDGFFRTGDQARIDNDGYVRITGRFKDLIVRGGVNIAPAEIEQILFTHPAITNAAVVGMPDPRLGERVCAFVTTTGPDLPDLEDITDWMNKNGISKQKWPERLEVVKNLPMTSSKKIQKFRLRQMITQTLEARPADTDP